MAIKINDLPIATTISDTDNIIIDTGVETKKVTKEVLLKETTKDTYTTLSVPTSGWTETTLEDETCYTLTLSLSGATSGTHPIISCVPSKPSTMDDENEMFGYLLKVVEQSDQLVLYSSEVPTVAYTLQVKNY